MDKVKINANPNAGQAWDVVGQHRGDTFLALVFKDQSMSIYTFPFLCQLCVIVYLKRTMTLSSSLSISSSLDSLLPALSYKNLLSILVLLDNIWYFKFIEFILFPFLIIQSKAYFIPQINLRFKLMH